MSATKRHIAWAATLVGVAGTLTALSPGLATAGIHGIELGDCSITYCPTPTSIVAGHSYSIVGPYDGTNTQHSAYSFYDNGACIGSGVSVTWVPLTAGSHTLSARNSLGFPEDSVTVTVVAAPAGSPTPQQPQQGGCQRGFGSGSADLLGSGSSNLLPGS
ncbi:hypothetical protein JMUB6875_70010 [Nocardia sp. JMUB6875]|uniref:hypothetical protein n=1 Tax=Nocardia sp. JMUB6875 TaxID=3158170 RepID=UPI0032E61A15